MIKNHYKQFKRLQPFNSQIERAQYGMLFIDRINVVANKKAQFASTIPLI